MTSQNEMKLSDVSVEYRGEIAIVRIDRGGASNAARPEMMQQLCEIFDELKDNEKVRALVLGHRGKHFMAGGDLTFLQTLGDATLIEIRDSIYRHFQGAVRRLYTFPKPTVAAVGGAAITVGCEAAIACDFRIVTERALFQESWIKLGLIPPMGGMKKLPALVGYGIASDMILRGRGVGGQEAIDIGLATELVAADALETRAIALAQELAALPPLAYAAAKSGMHQALENTFEQTWSTNVMTQGFLIKSEDFKEGVDAVVARRPGVFKGQ
ncbi:MAG TPA: enoyl-CoA hydratase/isomerase family protein [Spongiibacteraceae bacterium]